MRISQEELSKVKCMFKVFYFLLKRLPVIVLVDSCPHGWISGGYLGSCYHISQSQANISTAKAACASMYYNARLVSIESDAEFDFLRRHYQYLYDNESECIASILHNCIYSTKTVFSILLYILLTTTRYYLPPPRSQMANTHVHIIHCWKQKSYSVLKSALESKIPAGLRQWLCIRPLKKFCHLHFVRNRDYTKSRENVSNIFTFIFCPEKSITIFFFCIVNVFWIPKQLLLQQSPCVSKHPPSYIRMIEITYFCLREIIFFSCNDLYWKLTAATTKNPPRRIHTRNVL